MPWESDAPRRAGVSSFGVGGTNVHVVVEEAPQTSVRRRAAPSGPQVLLLSARTAESLQDAKAALAAELSARRAACRCRTWRSPSPAGGPHDVRMAAVVADRADACAVLTAAEHENVSVGQCPPGSTPGAQRVAFLFPGQGAQHVGMARGLYDTEPVFRENFDRCAAGFGDETGHRPEGRGVRRGPGLEPTDLAQPALFAVEYALAQLVMSYGVSPDGAGRPQHRRTRGRHRGRGFRPGDGDQGRLDAGTSDARRAGGCHGRRGVEPRRHRRAHDRRRRPRRGQRIRQLRGGRP